MRLVLLHICLLAGLSNSIAQTVDVDLMSRMNGFVFLDGGGTTGLWGYGYVGDAFITLPAPLLVFEQGDSVNIHFTNESPESHTIHLHGLDVDQVNDGVPSTSFYVIPDETVTYSFNADNPGTFLYHCHVTTTIHLTMGMYGMISVNGPDGHIFEGGPSYTEVYHFLSSDLEVETNDAPTDAFPFHEIYPDYFMINGKSGGTLASSEDNTVSAYVGDTIALRLGSMAYSKTSFVFPEGSNAKVWMSDGRPVPEPFDADTLEVYPGERYTVFLYPDESLEENIHVLYHSMLSNQQVGVNEISVVNLGIPDNISSFNPASPKLKIFPNPSNGMLTIVAEKATAITLYDVLGNVSRKSQLLTGNNTLDLSSLSSGVYFIKDLSGGIQRVVIQ